MDFLKKNAGPIIYTLTAVLGIYWFYWFGALYH
jgi:hypothetical protein